MADADKKRYYWLKLKEDFFKRHDIRIIEAMPNGKDYIIFYLKLLCESCGREGRLRFNHEIPYNEEMLATITNTNVDVVRSAVKIFTSLQMMEVLDDGTYFLTKVQSMIGSETGAANRKRAYRNKLLIGTSSGQCPLDIEKDIDIDIEKDKEGNKKASRFSKTTIYDIQDYCNERKNNVDAQKFYDYYESVGWKVGKNPMKDWKACVRTWERNTFDNNQNQKKGQGINITQFDV